MYICSDALEHAQEDFCELYCRELWNCDIVRASGHLRHSLSDWRLAFQDSFPNASMRLVEVRRTDDSTMSLQKTTPRRVADLSLLIV